MANQKNKGLIIAGIIAGAVLVSLAMKSKASATPPDPETGKANLYGTVTDLSTGAKLSGVNVSLGSLQTVTDNNGYYEFLNLQPGSYTANFSKEGYL